LFNRIRQLFLNPFKPKTNKPGGFIDFLSNLSHLGFTPQIIVEIGAHYGLLTHELCSKFPCAEIYAIEPATIAFKNLKQNLQDVDNVKMFKYAIGNYNGRALLNINSFDETNSLLQAEEASTSISGLLKHESSEEVEILTLDTFCVVNQISSIDLLKIDAQGYSYEILEGAQRIMKLQIVKHLFIEAELQTIYKNEKLFPEIEELLNGYSYRLVQTYNCNSLDRGTAWADFHFAKA